MKYYSVVIISMLLVSCSYLPEEAVDEIHLKKETADYALYYSGEQLPEKAFLFVPGGLVDPYGYTCWIDELASRHSNVAIVLAKYPSNLAISNIGKSHSIKRELEHITNWIIGGHSLGGVVASTLVHEYPLEYDGLVLMASYSREATALGEWYGSVLSIYGSQDALATAEEVLSFEEYLPPGSNVDLNSMPDEIENRTFYHEITGGNHAGFGCYGDQEGDGNATIDKQIQQDEMIEVLKLFMDALWD